MAGYKDSLAFRYLQGTKYDREKPLRDNLGDIPPPARFKVHPQAERFPLPDPDLNRSADLWQCLSRRRSERDTTPEPVTLQELSLLLWAAQGVTARAGGYLLRTAPSAGALYPFETYLYADRVEGLTKGLYHLEVGEFCLERLKGGDLNRALTAGTLGQSAVRRAAVVLVWSAVLLRCMVKYRERAVRYIAMDLGHVCQNVQLAATAMGLGSCPIGAFYDDEINRMLGVDGEEETVLYLATVGRLERGTGRG
ncbi:MAG TPA: SagB/ThcOx family dehydrogenase [Syntrophobacteria bacterium]|nr:SagB/ThcOx family dehydrogenase [Syntrophobacteria bacterium]